VLLNILYKEKRVHLENIYKPHTSTNGSVSASILNIFKSVTRNCIVAKGIAVVLVVYILISKWLSQYSIKREQYRYYVLKLIFQCMFRIVVVKLPLW